MRTSKLLGTAITCLITSLYGYSSSAQASQLIGWQLDVSSLAAAGGGSATPNTGLTQLDFSGESYVSFQTFNPVSTGFTFNDTGVFKITGHDGAQALSLGTITIPFIGSASYGELTAVFNATGTGSLTSGGFSFNPGGSLNIYYGLAQNYGQASSNHFNAGDGTLIASFSQLGGGGLINADGTPSANGMINLLYQSTFLDPNVWKDSSSTSLVTALTLGFVTSNASQDNSANAGAPFPINPNLVAALGGAGSTPNCVVGGSCGLPHFYVVNGGQIKLETPTVPEPGSLALLGIGLLGAAYSNRRLKA